MIGRNVIVTTAAFAVFSGSMVLGGWAWAQETSGAQEHPTAPQLIEAFEPEWNDEQEAILADGVITREEYDSTINRVAACLERNGMTVHRERGTGPGGVDLLWDRVGKGSGE